MNKQVGFIYKISSKFSDMIYIGSTIQTPIRRYSKHKSDFKKGVLRCTSKILLELGDTEFTELVSCNFTNKQELRDLEYQVIKQYGNKSLNIQGIKESLTPEYKAKHYQKKFYCEKCNKEYYFANKQKHLRTDRHLKN